MMRSIGMVEMKDTPMDTKCGVSVRIHRCLLHRARGAVLWQQLLE